MTGSHPASGADGAGAAPWLTIRQAAEWLDTSPQVLHAAMRRGELRAARRCPPGGGRPLLHLHRAALRRWALPNGYRPKEVAALSGYSVHTIHNALRCGALPAFRVRRRCVIPTEFALAFIEAARAGRVRVNDGRCDPDGRPLPPLRLTSTLGHVPYWRWRRPRGGA